MPLDGVIAPHTRSQERFGHMATRYPQATPADVPAAPPAQLWGVLALLAVGVLIAFVDRTSVSSALAVPAFNRHFGLSNVDRGWVGAAFFWSYGLIQIPMGWIVDRYGVKVPYAI